MDNKDFLDSFLTELSEKEYNYNFIKKSLVDQEEKIEELREKHRNIVKQISLDTKSSSAIQLIFDKVSDSGFKFLEDLINQGLLTVYPTQPMLCEIRIGNRGKEKTVEFWLDDGKSINPLTECGGGPQSVVSLVLRIYYIVKNNLRRVVFLDESFTAISGVQLEPFLCFLQSLVDNLGFGFIWITHNNDIIEYCDHAYEMFNGILEKRK
jgi:DNA repair exonuclease SbcCD ATPase subunit